MGSWSKRLETTAGKQGSRVALALEALEPRYEVGNAPSSVVSGDFNDYGRPDVGGAINEDSSDEDTDTIHADTGSYFVIDSAKFAPITAEQSATFGGLTASVA